MTHPHRSRWILAPAGLAAAAALTACGPSAGDTSGKNGTPPRPASGPASAGGTVSASVADPAATSTATSTAMSTATSGTPTPDTPTPGAAGAGAGVGACYEGGCVLTVTEPVTVPLDPRRFGFSAFRVTALDAAGVTVAADDAGNHLQSRGSAGSTIMLNRLTVRILAASARSARLEVPE